MPFDNPSAPGAGIDFNDHLGALILFEVHGIETGISTMHGIADAVRVDAIVIEGPGAGDEYNDALLFQKVLGSQLRRSIGRKVLGRLTQGVAKPGKSAPWQLAEASAADIAKAEAWAASIAPTTTAPAPPF